MSDHTWDEIVDPGFVSVRWSLERFQDGLNWLEGRGDSECGEFGQAAKAIGKLIEVLNHVEERTYRLRDADETQNPDFEWSAVKPSEGGEPTWGDVMRRQDAEEAQRELEACGAVEE